MTTGAGTPMEGTWGSAMSEQKPTSVNWVLLSLFRRGLSREQAANYIGIGPTKFDKMVKDGRMPRPKRVDGRVVWDLRKLDAAFDALEEDDPDKPKDPNPWDGN
jgi:predicted DNA-binding transcriptional regulator AlpA